PPRCRGRHQIYGSGRAANWRKHLYRNGRSRGARGAMRDFLARRLLSIVAGAFALSMLVFVLVRLVPGDAVTMWLGAEGTMSPEVQNTLRNLFGLNDPIYVQYAKWLGNVAHGDLGYS